MEWLKAKDAYAVFSSKLGASHDKKGQKHPYVIN